MGISIPIVCSTDNRSLVDNVFSTKVQHDKRLRVEIAYLRTMVESGVISRLQWVPTNEQLADCLTKISNHAADDLIRYLHEKPAYIQASVLQEAFTEEANARLRLPSEAFSSFGDVFKYGEYVIVCVYTSDEWLVGFVIERISSDVLTNFTPTTETNHRTKITGQNSLIVVINLLNSVFQIQ